MKSTTVTILSTRFVDKTVVLYWGHSSAGRAPAWHEATKSIDKAKSKANVPFTTVVENFIFV